MPAAKNNLPARESIIKRADYSVNAIPFLPEANEPTLETTQLKDFLLNEKIFIGRVDGSFNPVFVNQKELDNFGPDSSTKVGLRVVTEAYKDMKRKYDRDFAQGYINQNAPALTELSVKKAFINPFDNYKNNLRSRTEEFLSYAKNNRLINNIEGFDSFVNPFLQYIRDTGKERPITRSMYFLTRRYSPLSTGLAFEVDNASYSEDQYKIDAYYRQKNFQYFKNLASRYGFVIDKNIPWRLVADLNSPQMTPYVEKAFGFPGGSNYVLAVAYTQTYGDDIPSIINLMAQFYNRVAQHRRKTVIRESGPTVGAGGRTAFNVCSRRGKVIRRSQVDPRRIPNAYPDEFWLDKYARIRNTETGLDYDEAQIQQISTNAGNIVKRLDRASAMRYIISKFDNVQHFEGSLFYDSTRLDFARQGLGDEADVLETVKRSVQASNFVIY
tara:strand:- start:2652 stop:3974 length:1323 start_codon:yes stop_codon:yes gene_type:complete